MASGGQHEQESPESGHYRIKILVPSVAAGAIIGKGGETIAQLQKDTGTRIIMSKVRDFYPGTNERVCLISGNVEGILLCLEFIMEKFKEKPDYNAKAGADRKITVEREKQVKILVPNSTASMIIGERGNYIKQIKKESGSMVQISQKCNDTSLWHSTLIERCITVTGDIENNKQACRMILEKIVEDPHSGICSNVSYADVAGPVANSDPTGSPFANSDLNSSGSMKSIYSNSSNSSVSNVSHSVANKPEAVVPFTGSSPVLGAGVSFIENVARVLRANGFLEQAISEITVALSTLESFGVLSFILTVLSSFALRSTYGYQIPYSPVVSTSLPHMAVSEDVTLSSGSVPNVEVGFDPSVANGSPMDQSSGFQHFPESRYHHLFLTDAEAAAFDPLYSSSPTIASPAAASLPIRSSSIDWNTPFQTHFDNPPIAAVGENVMGEATQLDIEVAESIVGAILGQGGKVLVEIQQLSGANVQISKKGIFAPGTLNRIVSITGPPNAVCTAQSLIEQRITEAKLKRGQQSAFGTHLSSYSIYNG